jgi:hypothetical protein
MTPVMKRRRGSAGSQGAAREGMTEVTALKVTGRQEAHGAMAAVNGSSARQCEGWVGAARRAPGVGRRSKRGMTSLLSEEAAAPSASLLPSGEARLSPACHGRPASLPGGEIVNRPVKDAARGPTTHDPGLAKRQPLYLSRMI